MGEKFDSLDNAIQNHLKGIMPQTNLEDTDESLEMLAQSWLEKQQAFENEIETIGMEEAESFGKDEERGCLLMTYSGSLLTIGPKIEEGRKIKYVSIGLRNDVPQTAESEGADLKNDVELAQEVEFTSGPIKKSSAIFKIAVTVEELEYEEENEKLSEVTQIITDDFIEVNKTIVSE